MEDAKVHRQMLDNCLSEVSTNQENTTVTNTQSLQVFIELTLPHP